jgi:hypothetical protein
VLDATEKVWKQSPESFRFGTSKFIESSFQWSQKTGLWSTGKRQTTGNDFL